MQEFDPENFDSESFKSSHVGSVHVGNSSIYDFEVYRIDGELWFMCHEDPEIVQSYEEVKAEMFTDPDGSDKLNSDDQTLDEQLQSQGLVV